MRSLMLVFAEANAPDSGAAMRTVVLIAAALTLYLALTMLRQALQPLREVLRALAAAAGVACLVVLALILVLASLVFPR